MSTAIETKQPAAGGALTVGQKHATLRDFFSGQGVKNAIKMALPEHITPDRLVRVALTACMKNPDLLDCTRDSLYAALLLLAEMGLEPNGRDAHLIPFNNKKRDEHGREYTAREVQVIADYKGLIKLAYQSGQVLSCECHAVYERDKFRYRFGTGAFVEFEPADSEDRGPLKYAWAMAHLKGGGSPFVVLNRSEVMQHKKASRSAGNASSPWQRYEASMWAKTAFRVLSKFIPQSARLERAIAVDMEADLDKEGIIDMPAPNDGSTASERLAAQMGLNPPANGSPAIEAPADTAPDVPPVDFAPLQAELAACEMVSDVLAVEKRWREAGVDSYVNQDWGRLTELVEARKREIHDSRGGRAQKTLA